MGAYDGDGVRAEVVEPVIDSSVSRSVKRKSNVRNGDIQLKDTSSRINFVSDQPSFASINLVRSVGGLGLLLAACVWAYWPTLREIVGQWVNQPDYSHGFLVLPLALFFLWSRRSQCPLHALHPSLWGAMLLLFACGLRVAAGLFFLGPLDGWTIPVWIAGAVWLLFGWQCLRWSLPAIAFLWFMIPIPFTAEYWLSVPLQAVATKLSTAALVMLGQPALAEGNTIWIGDQQLFIEEACSGLRIFVGIFALAFAFALLSRWTWWQKALALVAALPIAIVANVVRVVVTGLLYQFASGDVARQFSHDLSGLVMIPFAAALFWLFLVYLDRLFPIAEEYSVVEAVAFLGRSR
jgi:exosortase